MPSLLIDIAANVAKLQTDINKAQKTVDGFGDTVKKTFRTAVDAIGAIGLGRAILSEAKAAIEGADQLNKLSKSTGMAVEQLSGLKYAADLSGVSIEEASRGVNILARNMAEAAKGTGEQYEAFKLLGIQIKDSQGNLVATDDVLNQVADRFQRMPDGATKAALSMQLFGKSGAELIPLLNEGSEGLERMRIEAGKTGQIISTETAAAAERFNDNLTRLGKLASGSANILMEKFLPALESTTSKLLGIGGITGDLVENQLKGELAELDRQLKFYTEKSEKGENFVNRMFGWSNEHAQRQVQDLQAKIAVVKGSLGEISLEKLPGTARSIVGELRPLEIAMPDKTREKAMEQLDRDILQSHLAMYRKMGEDEYAAYHAPTWEADEKLRQHTKKLDNDALENFLRVNRMRGEDEEKAWNTSVKISRRAVYEHKRQFGDFFDGVKWGYDDLLAHQVTVFDLGERTVLDFADTSRHTLKGVFLDGFRGELDTFGEYWNSFWDDMKVKFAESMADMAVDWSTNFLQKMGQGLLVDLGADWASDLLTDIGIFHAGLWASPEEQAAIIKQGEMVIPENIAELIRKRFSSFQDFAAIFGAEGAPGGPGAAALGLDMGILGAMAEGAARGAARGFLAGGPFGAMAGGILGGARGGITAASGPSASIVGFLGTIGTLALGAPGGIIGMAAGLLADAVSQALGYTGLFGLHGLLGPSMQDPHGWSTHGEFGLSGQADSGAGEYGGGIYGYAKGTGLAGLPGTGRFYGHAGEIVLNPRESEFARRMNPEAIGRAVAKHLGRNGGISAPVVYVMIDGKALDARVYEATKEGRIRVHPRGVTGGKPMGLDL